MKKTLLLLLLANYTYADIVEFTDEQWEIMLTDNQETLRKKANEGTTSPKISCTPGKFTTDIKLDFTNPLVAIQDSATKLVDNVTTQLIDSITSLTSDEAVTGLLIDTTASALVTYDCLSGGSSVATQKEALTEATTDMAACYIHKSDAISGGADGVFDTDSQNAGSAINTNRILTKNPKCLSDALLAYTKTVAECVTQKKISVWREKIVKRLTDKIKADYKVLKKPIAQKCTLGLEVAAANPFANKDYYKDAPANAPKPAHFLNEVATSLYNDIGEIVGIKYKKEEMDLFHLTLRQALNDAYQNAIADVMATKPIPMKVIHDFERFAMFTNLHIFTGYPGFEPDEFPLGAERQVYFENNEALGCKSLGDSSCSPFAGKSKSLKPWFYSSPSAGNSVYACGQNLQDWKTFDKFYLFTSKDTANVYLKNRLALKPDDKLLGVETKMRLVSSNPVPDSPFRSSIIEIWRTSDSKRIETNCYFKLPVHEDLKGEIFQNFLSASDSSKKVDGQILSDLCSNYASAAYTIYKDSMDKAYFIAQGQKKDLKTAGMPDCIYSNDGKPPVDGKYSCIPPHSSASPLNPVKMNLTK